MSKNKLLVICIGIEVSVIVSIAISTLFQGIRFALFYNIVYGLILSVCIPLYITNKSKDGLSTLGIKKIGTRQLIVLLSFVIFSVGGQIIPRVIAGEPIAWRLLPICIAPLIMTTFFEELLFRGFIQTRVEKHVGSILAIIISGLMFSLYHLGYPGFRTAKDLLLLFVVGLGFSIAFKLSNNNLIVAYFVNLPNAFITYLLKSEQFPPFNGGTTIYAVITVVVITMMMSLAIRKTTFAQPI